jgi:hypothetical protein
MLSTFAVYFCFELILCDMRLSLDDSNCGVGFHFARGSDRAINVSSADSVRVATE